jgi:hypothetical protein
VRAKINTFLATKEMTQTKFLETIGANSNSFRRFMSYTGRDRGRDNSTYEGALVFFAEREKKEKLKKEEEKALEKQQAKALKKIGGSSGSVAIATPNKKRSVEEMTLSTVTPNPVDGSITLTVSSSSGSSEPKAKRSTSTKSAAVDELLQTIANVPLDDMRVFDDCDDVRAKIATYVHGTKTVSMAKFAEAVDATPRAVTMFMAKKGWNEGAGSKIYVNSYRFFEKLRMLNNEAKSNKRIKNEQKHPNGFELEDPPRYVWTFAGF